MGKSFIPSVLFEEGGRVGREWLVEPPSYLSDLNLDQAVDGMVGDREFLTPWFGARLGTAAAIAYRHEVFRDLEKPELLSAVAGFVAAMGKAERSLAQARDRHYYRYEPAAWLLDAARHYCQAVEAFGAHPSLAAARSRGLAAVRAHAQDYLRSELFRTLVSDVEHVAEGLAAIRYAVTIRGDRVKVARYEGEPDFSAEILETFERFKQGAAEDYTVRLGLNYLNHVEARIVELVARLHPDPFAALDEFGDGHRAFQDETLVLFAREVQFYLAYAEHMAWLRAEGLSFCYPRVCDDKEVYARDAFDIALAAKLVARGSSVVCNDFELSEPERIIVVSGPNQGGKTTFARMFGQLHHLAGVGLPVPGSEARLHLCDQLFAHFEREEDLSNLSGKLADDLVRIHRILERATPESVVVMNESLTSTTLHDAVVLGRAVLAQLVEFDLLCVYVTFVDELASLGQTTVSMMSTVPPDDPASRTHKVVRRPADGLAYAVALAGQHGLSYERVRERVAR